MRVLPIAVLVACAAPVSAGQGSPVERAESLYRAFEFDAAVDLLEGYTQTDPGKIDADAHRLLGECFSVLGRVSDAERAFRTLLELRPDFDMPDTVSPKISLIFRQAKAEHDARRTAERDEARRRLIDSIPIHAEFPHEATGGEPISLRVRVNDPRSAVFGVRIAYRRPGDPSFSSLALERNDGVWTGALPAELTSNPDGMSLEFYVETIDREGRGLKDAPVPPDVHSVRISPGEVETGALLEKWWFWTAVVGVAAAGTTAAIVLSSGNTTTDLPVYAFPP